MTDGAAGHGPHVLPPQPDCRPITWQAALPPEDRRKVLRWTCTCKPLVYYLITSGGRGYVERATRGGDTDQTPRLRYAPLADLWEHLLLGRAR
ncbi:hypothetical protein Ssi03_58970 [Sphaerisporangium siamense]|uniref:Uncharacterized protein n=1 Tax=Sphaerisporangium siamense TaxID=795645 RepID=A0A7W7D6B9_9ACTN|nr:hypothetical protein [Sphaerisporangium siamense]MBB4699726.1 hypothetical protein [Sphaerisporangium siamense]GII87907.1 hypothetical protein Ssi03_58970 [Sphaerisporangium siamense]